MAILSQKAVLFTNSTNSVRSLSLCNYITFSERKERGSSSLPTPTLPFGLDFSKESLSLEEAQGVLCVLCSLEKCVNLL